MTLVDALCAHPDPRSYKSTSMNDPVRNPMPHTRPGNSTDLEKFTDNAVDILYSNRTSTIRQLFVDTFDILSSTSDDNRRWPSLQVLIPIVLSYTLLDPEVRDSDNLRSLYACLLASAMARNTAWDVHPSFAHLLSQMSEQDAQVEVGAIRA